MARGMEFGGTRCGWPQALLFDLDGTLVDSVPDLASAVNRLLAAEGLDPLTRDAVRGMVGNGLRKLVERAFAARGRPLDAAGLDAMSARMTQVYGERLTEETVLMAGAGETVAAYASAGVGLAVVTNKPEALSRRILAHFGLDTAVPVVIGGDTCATRKPDPEMLHAACAALGVPASRALMVGDSAADIDAARAAGMACVALRGGYTRRPVEELGADMVIDGLAGLPQAIERLKEPA